jgi:hypothetical protein
MVFRFRADGDLVTDAPPTRRIMPFIMPRRNESLVFFDIDVDAAAVDARLAAWRARGIGASVMHIVAIAAVRVLHERPRLNRFVAGGRHWQRRGIWVSFSGKKRKTDDAPVVAIKREIAPELSDEAIVAALDGAVQEVRASTKNHVDKELDVLLALPTFALSWVVRVLLLADHWGLLPRVFIDGDPLYASIFIANLGSLGMDAAQHHLYEYGTIPLFCVIGKKKTAVALDATGQVVGREVYPLRFTFDERVEDGLYCLGALTRLKALIETDGAVDATKTAT